MRSYYIPNPSPHGPDRKGKKRFQGKETAGCVPLGYAGKYPKRNTDNSDPPCRRQTR